MQAAIFKKRKMKNRKLTWLLCALLPLGIAAQAQTKTMKKMLVAYYSYSGNTRAVAENIARQTGADLFEIVPAEAYPTDYDAVVAQARREIGAGYRPALKHAAPDLAQYDVVFVGSPCWWATVAPPVATFLASNDFTGKTIVPFMTHEGSRMGHTEADIRKLCPGAAVLAGFPVRGSSASASGEAVRQWLNALEK